MYVTLCSYFLNGAVLLFRQFCEKSACTVQQLYCSTHYEWCRSNVQETSPWANTDKRTKRNIGAQCLNVSASIAHHVHEQKRALNFTKYVSSSWINWHLLCLVLCTWNIMRRTGVEAVASTSTTNWELITITILRKRVTCTHSKKKKSEF